MEDAGDLLSRHDAPPRSTRNGTELSELCDRLLTAFLRSGAPCCAVHWERTKYPMDKLYDGLRNACRKNDYRSRVTAHKEGGRILLCRRRKDRHER